MDWQELKHYFEIAGRCSDGTWHSSASFSYSGYDEYEVVCEVCGKTMGDDKLVTMKDIEDIYDLPEFNSNSGDEE